MYDEIRSIQSVGRTSEYIGAMLAGRLIELRDGLAEEGDELSLESVLGLVRFYVANKGVRPPSLVVTVDGNVRAEWFESLRHYFAVEFMPDGDAKIVASPARPGDTARAVIACNGSEIMDMVTKCGLDDVLSNKLSISQFGRSGSK